MSVPGSDPSERRVDTGRRERRTFEAEARRQSRAIAERSRDPRSDDHASLVELEALFDADHFASEWIA